MTPLTAIIIFGVLGLGAVYVLWPSVLRPRVVRRLEARKARLAATDAALERNWNMSRGNMPGVGVEEQGEWRVIQLDPPRDRSQWPTWHPTPKGRWES